MLNLTSMAILRLDFPIIGVTSALLGAIWAMDYWLPLGLQAAVLYVVPVLTSSWIRSRRATPLVAVIASVLTLADAFVEGPSVVPYWVVLCNRSLALLAVWTTTVLCVRRQHSEEELRWVYEGIERQIAERTAELEKANRELDAMRQEALLQLAEIVKSSDDAIIGKTPDGIIRSWNAGAERIYGYRAEEVIGRPISLLCPPNRPDEIPAMLERIRRGEHVRNFETVRRRKDGKKIDVSLTISPVKDAAGRIVGVSSIARDITERKRIEAALRESEARFHMMADTAPVMVWMAGPDTQCTFVNKRWLEFTGRTLEQELGDAWISGVHPSDMRRCLDTYLSAFQTEQPFTMEYRLRRADGQYRWVLDTGIPLFEADGTFAGFIGSCMDLTERKEMEDQLRKALKEKESLLREVHHRVKNNLQVISSLLNLQSASIKDQQIAQLFKECQTRITSIALLHETLHRSQDLSQIKMGDYIRTLTGHLFRSYGVDPRQIVLDLNVEDVEFDLDTGMTCGLIVDELVANCLKHAFQPGRQGHIQVDLVANPDNTYTLRVSDDGAGLPKDGILRNPDSLGLELVGLLAEKLEGTVELQSGKGTEWRIRFRTLNYQERM